jgi:hypothetical protein
VAALQFDAGCALREPRRVLGALALAVALTLAATPAAFAQVSTGGAALVVHGSSLALGFQTFAAISDPPTSIAPSPATFQACDGAPDSTACISSALSDIDAARAAEGVAPMQLPADFASLSVPEQLLVVTNLERVDRGLAPVAGLAADLDSVAASAAAADQDPMLNNFNGTELASNWAGGMSSTLLTDFVWMYDDGPGSGNLDCRQAGDSGCWGHRDNILYRFDNPVAMGVGYDVSTAYGPSLTELFVGGDTATGPGQADALLAPTWNQLSGQSSTNAPNDPVAQHAAVTRSQQVSQGQTSFQIRVRRTRIRRGQKVALNGRLRSAGHGVEGQLVTLVRHAPRSTRMVVVTRRRTRAGGRVRFHVSPEANMDYSIVFWGSTRLAASSTCSVELHVRRSG